MGITDTIQLNTGLQASLAVSYDETLNGPLDDIKTFLLAAGIKEPIYTGALPPLPDNCLSLYEYAGRPPATHGVNIETPGLQIRIRQAIGPKDYQKCRARADHIQAILHDKKNFAMSRTQYLHVIAQQSPSAQARDDNNRISFIINFLIMKRPL